MRAAEGGPATEYEAKRFGLERRDRDERAHDVPVFLDERGARQPKDLLNFE